MTTVEQRTHARYRIPPGTFAYYALGQAVIRDLSLGGVFVEDREHTPATGTEVDLEFHLDDEIIALRGTVRRVEPQVGFAVQFHELTAETKDRLEKYFRKHLGLSGKGG
jgi:hypothetical protein